MKPTPKYQQLQFDERIALCNLQAQGFSKSAMALLLDRSPATISREFVRNAPSGQYSCTFAQRR